MPELRKDPVVGRWVIIATERARRPGNIVDRTKRVFNDSPDALQCVEQETVYQSGHVRVVQSCQPYLTNDQPIKREKNGLYDVINGYGVHEVVIETPSPIPNMADLEETQIAHAIIAYRERIEEHRKDPDIQYILIYKTFSASDTEEHVHSHTHILASPVVPLHVKSKLEGAKKYFDFHERNVFEDIAAQEHKSKKRIVNQTRDFIAVMPFASRFPFEVMILPKKTHHDFAQSIVGKEAKLAKFLKGILRRIEVGLDDPAYTLVINTAPIKSGSNGFSLRSMQENYCWNIEITPRITHVAGFEKGSGFYICPIPPEETANFLRTVELNER